MCRRLCLHIGGVQYLYVYYTRAPPKLAQPIIWVSFCVHMYICELYAGLMCSVYTYTLKLMQRVQNLNCKLSS